MIKTKVENKNFDTFSVQNWLGHTEEKTTQNYIQHAEMYYRQEPVDWIAFALKPENKRMGGKQRQKNNLKNQQNPDFRSVDRIFSERAERICRDLNPG